MNLNTVTMPEVEARQKVAEYREAVRKRHSAEDEQILRGYREIVKGHEVISLPDAFKKAGWHLNGTPRLGIVRADAERCFALDKSDGVWKFSAYRDDLTTWRRIAWQRRPIALQLKEPEGKWRPDRTHETIAPIVPPALRPSRGLHLYHVLFEVEEWKPVPPVDPALLRHIGGDLWAVIAVWDLTKLERLVLAGR